MNVPKMLMYLCLAFYFHGECFNKCGYDLQISKDKMTIYKIFNNNNHENRAFGKCWISAVCNKIAKWTFKINHIGEFSSIKIGLVTNDNNTNSDHGRKDTTDGYWLSIEGNRALPIAGYTINADDDSTDILAKSDEMTLIYDARHNIFKVEWVEDNLKTNRKLIINDNIESAENMKYKIAVCLENKNDKLTLVNFDLVKNLQRKQRFTQEQFT